MEHFALISVFLILSDLNVVCLYIEKGFNELLTITILYHYIFKLFWILLSILHYFIPAFLKTSEDAPFIDLTFLLLVLPDLVDRFVSDLFASERFEGVELV